MGTSLQKKGQPKSKKIKEDSATKKHNKTPRKKATFAPEDSEESGRKKEELKEAQVALNAL
jgi:hypothetical protein